MLKGNHNPNGASPVQRPISVNWTVTTWCNYRCKYCFARFPELAGMVPLSFQDMKRIVELLANAGCEKLTFVGGEPTLCPKLPELLTLAHSFGITTMIVSNGTRLTEEFLEKNAHNIDWISLSVDSQHEDVQARLGRGCDSHVAQTVRVVELVRRYDIRLKINTVVTRYNHLEDMSDFIASLEPERWKVFQFLLVKGQNDAFARELDITPEEFAGFRIRHRHLPFAVFEDNDAMTGSYLMLSPHGRFFNNDSGEHTYTDSILDVGVLEALEQNRWNKVKFVARGGIYDWAGSGQSVRYDRFTKPTTQEVIA